MSGRLSRNKGARNERAIVNLFQDAGIHSERVPLSGAAGGSYVGDLTIAVNGEDWTCEAKLRAAGFKSIYDWLGSHRALFIRADRREPLVVIRVSDFVGLIKSKWSE